MITLSLLIQVGLCAWAQQQPALPAVNLGDTNFLDGVGFPGWLVEEIGQRAHDGKTLPSSGNPLRQPTDVSTGTSLTHVAWLANRQFLGGWYGAEVVLPAAYVDTGGHGVGKGMGDLTVGPIVQWPEKQVFGRHFYQRAVFDIDVPTGRYSRNAEVNIGNNAWALNPYYAFTVFPSKRWETS